MIIKDNGIWTHLAYSDHDAGREYILSDFTDINPLRFRLDDNFFSKGFWYDYFDNLEKIFNWNIVDKNSLSIFTFRKFKDEGDGISGLRIQIDDNQKFFDKIFQSVRDFSNDISLRVVDDRYMETLLKGLADRLGYEDLLYIDMDLYDLSVFRVIDVYDKDKNVSKAFFKSKKSWSNDLALIDSLRDNRFRAFLGTDVGNSELINCWSNFVLDKPLVVKEQSIVDIIRSYCTIQNFSLLRDNKQKLQKFGMTYENTCVIVSGSLSRILGKSKTLLSIIDGLELEGEFDCIFDFESKILTFGKSYVSGLESADIILTKKDFLSSVTKVIIPQVKGNVDNKVIASGTIESLDVSKSEFYVIAPQFTYLNLPRHEEKLIIEGKFRNGAKLATSWEDSISMLSIPGSKQYESLLVDARPRPIVYGPDIYANKIKLQRWLNDNKA